jgi:hypothetical protein
MAAGRPLGTNQGFPAAGPKEHTHLPRRDHWWLPGLGHDLTVAGIAPR